MQLTELPRWKQDGGRDFIFFHPSLELTGPASLMHTSMLCAELYRSIHIVTGHEQFRMCPVISAASISSLATPCDMTSPSPLPLHLQGMTPDSITKGVQIIHF